MDEIVEMHKKVFISDAVKKLQSRERPLLYCSDLGFYLLFFLCSQERFFSLQQNIFSCVLLFFLDVS